VQLVLQYPSHFAKGSFEANCTNLAALAQASKSLRTELAAMPLQQLVVFTCCSTLRLKYVQYLVQTQQQTPWAFSLHNLLLSMNIPVGRLRERFCAAYPGFAQWEQAMTNL
jgi:hypothetical protein